MEYIAKKNGAGVIISISRADGVDVPIDAENQDYINFVNWAAKQTECVAESYEWLKPQYLYLNLANKSTLTDYFKNNGKMLFAVNLAGVGQPPKAIYQSRYVLRHTGTGTSMYDRNVGFVQIQEARTAPLNDDLDREGGVTPADTPLFVSEKLFDHINQELLDDESEVRKVSSWPVEKTFVYFDVSGFSRDHRPGQQALILNSLIRLINDERWWGHGTSDARADCESSLCIGDGYIYVFRHAHLGAYFAAFLANLIEHLIAEKQLLEFHFRVSVHRGPVYRFWDVSPKGEGKWNYVGRGITDAERVLSASGKEKDDVVYISAETREAIMPEFGGDLAYNISPWLQNRGRLADKHGQYRRIYEVNHTSWMEASGYSGSTSHWR